MKKVTMMMLGALVCAAVAGGCASARVVNEATYKLTAPDGSVTERQARNTIFALGDKAVEQNLKGSLADATEADLSAGIQESSQKSESGVIAEGMFTMGGKAIDVFGKYLDKRAGTGGADTETAAAAASMTAYSEDPAPETKAAGFAGKAGANGVGVYGNTTCSRCRNYKTAHPEVELIDLAVAENRTAMWAALRARGFAGTTVGLPVVVTETGYAAGAK